MASSVITNNHAINYINDDDSEMTHGEHKFLGTLLHMYKPSKILEVGVSAGLTSAFLLNNTGVGQYVYGVDVSNTYYKDTSSPVGFKIPLYCDSSALKRYRLFLGKDIVERIYEIGDNIDFCILDTTHTLPGELLQFLIVFPFMKEDSVLVLHDLSLNLRYASRGSSSLNPRKKASFATKLLFTTLGSSKKLLPNSSMPNIGAVIIDGRTKATIINVFLALGISWFYFPSELAQCYKKFIYSYYDGHCNEMFNSIISAQERLV